MQLSYRGIPYKKTSLELPTLATDTVVQYRGMSYPLRHAPINVPLHHSSGMIYRGVAIDRGFKGSFLGRSYYRCIIEFSPIATEA